MHVECFDGLSRRDNDISRVYLWGMTNECAPGEMRFESEVRSEQRNLPIAEALAQRFTYHSRQEWEARVLAGDVLYNDSPASPEQVVNTGDRLLYIVRNYSEPSVPTHYEILFENEEFLVVGKPAGVPVHHTGSIFWNTFASILRRALKLEELIPMHRLDRDTSGVMLFAKSQDTSKRYQKSLQHIVLRKIYLAVVDGDFPLAETTTLPPGATWLEGRLQVTIPLRELAGQAIRVQMVPDFETGKPCLTTFRLLQHTTNSAGTRRVSIVECELGTGRKHQIRAHLAALGYPILGDVIYNHGGQYYLKRCDTPLDAEDYQVLGARMQMLHAWKLELQLPGMREPKIFESRIFTDEMAAYCANVSARNTL